MQSVDGLAVCQIKRAGYLVVRCMDNYVNTGENRRTWVYSVDGMVQCDQINHPLEGVLQDGFLVRVRASHH